METLLYIIFAFFFGYAIGKIKGQDEIFDEWHKYIVEHAVYNPMTTGYEFLNKDFRMNEIFED